MTDKNADQNETVEVTEAPAPQTPAAPVGTFNLVFTGLDWQIQTNMGRHVLVGVLRDVINKLEAQPVAQPAVEPAQPADEAITPTPEEKDDAQKSRNKPGRSSHQADA